MRCILLASLLTILIHTTSLTEEITTGNLLPNGTGSASNLQSVVHHLLQLILHVQIQIGTIKK
jgi:hypothetical protein